MFSLVFLVMFQLLLFSLLGFQRPQFVEVEIPRELQEVEDDVRNLVIPTRFSPLMQSGTIFAFVHLRKAGGTTIRSKLYPYLYFRRRNFRSNLDPNQNSLDNQTVMFSACLSLPCETYFLDETMLERVKVNSLSLSSPMSTSLSSSSPVADTTTSVSSEKPQKPSAVWILGHISFGQLEKVIRLRNNHSVDCFTQFRQPMDRTLSCIYYRTLEEKKPRNISSFKDKEQFRDFLRNYTDKFGFGCNNEILRMFTAETNETFLNNPLHYDESYTRSLVEVAKRNIAQCVVFLMEHPKQNKVISSEFFREIAKYTWARDRKANKLQYPEDVSKLDQGFIEVIREQNQIDLELYEFGVRWHQRLYRFAARNKLLSMEINKSRT